MAQKFTEASFKELIDDNMDMFDMERKEAILDAIEQLKSQGISTSDMASFIVPYIKETEESGDEEDEETDNVDSHIPDDRENFYFQSDKDLENLKKYRERVNYDKGNALKLPFKAICLQTSKANKIAYVGGSSSVIRIIDLLQKKCTHELSGHKGPISAMVLSEELNILITGSWDKLIMIWDLSTKALLNQLEGHSDYIKSLCVHAPSKTLYSGSSDKSIRQWNLDTYKFVRQFPKEHRRPVEGLCVDHDNKTLYSCCSFGSIYRWDLESSNILARYEGHKTSVYDIYFDEEEGHLFSASADNSAISWDIKTGKPRYELKHPDWVRSLAFCDGFLLTGCRDGNIRLYDACDGEFIKMFEGHFDEVGCLEFGINSLQFVSGSLDGTLRQWIKG